MIVNYKHKTFTVQATDSPCDETPNQNEDRKKLVRNSVNAYPEAWGLYHKTFSDHN